MVLLDTNICIYLLNQRPGFEAILRRLDGRQQGEVALSAITLAELRFGIAANQRRDINLAKLELFLAVFEIAPFDRARRHRLRFAARPFKGAGYADWTAGYADRSPCSGAGGDRGNQQRPRIWPGSGPDCGKLAGFDGVVRNPHRAYRRASCPSR